MSTSLSTSSSSSSCRIAHRLVFVLFFISYISAVSGYFSIHYSADEEKNHARVIVPAGREIKFSKAPSAEQVADLYSRTMGGSPILHEVNFHLPSMDMTVAAQPAVLLEVRGGVLPSGLTAIASMMSSADLASSGAAPTATQVAQALRAHTGSPVAAQTMPGATAEDVARFIAAQTKPVFILHHQDRSLDQDGSPFSMPSSLPTVHPTIATAAAVPDLTVTPLTEFQIASYQITLWTAVGMVLLVFTAVGMVAGMEVIPDSLLFAKFQSTMANKVD